MNQVQIWIILASIFVVYATAELIIKIIKKEPLWKTLKRWLMNIFDTLTGG